MLVSVMDFTLTQEQYEALIYMAREGATTPQKKTELDQFLRLIEKANNITRYFLMIQWQELSAPLPQGTNFPEVWPPKLRKTIELVTRPIAKVDVEEMLKKSASEPTAVLVTRDPAGIVGWTELDDFFVT